MRNRLDDDVALALGIGLCITVSIDERHALVDQLGVYLKLVVSGAKPLGERVLDNVALGVVVAVSDAFLVGLAGRDALLELLCERLAVELCARVVLCGRDAERERVRAARAERERFTIGFDVPVSVSVCLGVGSALLVALRAPIALNICARVTIGVVSRVFVIVAVLRCISVAHASAVAYPLPLANRTRRRIVCDDAFAHVGDAHD
jgi:hypothetical protein